MKMMNFNFAGDVRGGLKGKISDNGRLKRMLKRYEVEKLL